MGIKSEIEVQKVERCSTSIAVICGGDSQERGISLNSARSVMDHLQGDDITLSFYYLDQSLRPYEISRAQLYSNTPSDFDFKLAKVGRPLSNQEFSNLLSEVDIAFPLIHGSFGEDGQIQSLLEEAGATHVGLTAESCKRAYDKYKATQELKKANFPVLECELLEPSSPNKASLMESFFNDNQLKQVVVKPCNTGSSIGVSVAHSPEDAISAADSIFTQKIDTRVIVEPLCKGNEFTVIVLEAHQNSDNAENAGQPVALIPTEIEILSEDKIFTYRKKYLSTHQTVLHSPPRFAEEVTQKIRKSAEEIFSFFKMKDYVRLDGWVLDSGEIVFSDINPISGMEQNSFFFQQCAQIGMSHRDALRYLIKTVADKNDIAFDNTALNTTTLKERMPVLFGGNTAERQVSLMSGTNVWLKLRDSEKYEPQPCFLDSEKNVWELPYEIALYHTTEEIESLCANAPEREEQLKEYRDEIRARLCLDESISSISNYLPKKHSLDQFIGDTPSLFIALHGGFGENGDLQAILRENNVKYTASGPNGSRIGMDKVKTAEAIKDLESQGIYSAKKRSISIKEASSNHDELWTKLASELNAQQADGTIIVKPQDDGCSAGIARLGSAKDLKNYVEAVSSGLPRIPAGTLSLEKEAIELSLDIPSRLLFEEFIVTDDISIQGNDLEWNHKTGLVEVTVGVIGKKGEMKAMSPSITVASGNILSLEEKFQGGTGVNITPPPEEYVPAEVTEKAKEKIALVANTIGLRGFARIDAFLNIKTGEVIIIEANTIPGMTPSTVIYHQALDEEVSMYPQDFLETVLEFSDR